MILHLIATSPFSHPAMTRCLECLGTNDSILLMEDGVLLLAQPKLLPDLGAHQHLYVIEQDVLARGLNSHQYPAVEPVNYEQFVELVTQHQKTLTW